MPGLTKIGDGVGCKLLKMNHSIQKSTSYHSTAIACLDLFWFYYSLEAEFEDFLGLLHGGHVATMCMLTIVCCIRK